MQHVNYPHVPGFLIDCEACESKCHCTYGYAECIFEGTHKTRQEKLDSADFGLLAQHSTPGLADDFFRYHDLEKTLVLDGGDVEAVGGFFQLLEVSSSDIAAYASEHGDPWITSGRNFSPGWYITQRNSDGIITGHFYGFEDTYLAEEKARSDFHKLEIVYEQWINATEGN